jgi:hypothetical protein
MLSSPKSELLSELHYNNMWLLLFVGSSLGREFPWVLIKDIPGYPSQRDPDKLMGRPME